MYRDIVSIVCGEPLDAVKISTGTGGMTTTMYCGSDPLLATHQHSLPEI